MKRSSVAAATVLLLACSEGGADHGVSSLPGNPGPEASASGGIASSSSGASASGGESSGKLRGGAGPQAGGGAGRESVEGLCGDGVVSEEESCDTASPLDRQCADIGFEGGTLQCAPDCTLDTSQCAGTEQCGDGKDNDGDSLVDCEDTEQCAASCAAPCDNAVPLADGTHVTSSTSGGELEAVGGCQQFGGVQGPRRVFAFEALNTGVLQAQLTGTAGTPSLSVRTACNDAATEVACSLTRITVPVFAGDTRYLVVAGLAAGEVAPFTLTAASYPIVCGDEFLAGAEQCDDGNTVAGDGCAPDCTVEATEAEPNNTPATANAFSTPFYGFIASGDTDVIAIDIATAGATPTVSVQGATENACQDGTVDSLLRVIGPDQSTVIVTNDDGGEKGCSLATISNLAVGPHYIEVSASSYGATPEFAYQVIVTGL